MRTLLIGITVLLVALAGPAVTARADDRDAAPFGRMTIEGVIASVDPGSSTFLLRVFRPDGARRFSLDYLPAWVQQGTRIEDEDDNGFRRSAIREFRRGDRVKVDGFRLDDGRLLALGIEVKDRAFASPVVVTDIVFRGVVVARGANLIVILDTGGGTRIILISGTTRIRGLRASWVALQAHDSVVILGQPNADGTVAAREVQVIGVSR